MEDENEVIEKKEGFVIERDLPPVSKNTPFTPAVIAHIINKVSEGEFEFHVIKELGLNWGSWCRTKRYYVEHAGFCAALANARDDWGLAWEGKLKDIAWDDSRDVIETEETFLTKSGDTKTVKRRTSDNTAVNRDRLKIDSVLKWVMGKRLPQYSDKVALTNSKGGDLIPNINISIKSPKGSAKLSASRDENSNSNPNKKVSTSKQVGSSKETPSPVSYTDVLEETLLSSGPPPIDPLAAADGVGAHGDLEKETEAIPTGPPSSPSALEEEINDILSISKKK